MMKVSTARETLERMNKRAAAEPNPKYRRWIEVNRDHWWGEVIGDVGLTMTTMSRGPIRYTYDGHPIMKPVSGAMTNINSYEATRDMYQAIMDMGMRPAGPMDEERFMLDDQGLFVYGLLTAIYRGSFLTHHDEPIDADALYLVRIPNLTRVEFDDEGLMKGEDIINSAPRYLKKVDSSFIEKLVDGPIVLP